MEKNVSKTNKKVLISLTILAVSIWFTESALDFIFFNPDKLSFFNILVPLHNPHDLYFKIFILGMLLIGGLSIWKIYRNQTGSEEKKYTERALLLEKQFSENLLDTANLIIIALDMNANIMIFNKFTENLTGYKKSEVLGKNWFEYFIPEDSREEIPSIFTETLSTMPEASQHNNPIILKDGSKRSIQWNNSTIRDSFGKVQGILSFGLDITEQEHQREELRHLRNYLSNIINSMPSVLIGIDADYRITQWNMKAEETTGIKSRDALGKFLTDVYPLMESETDIISESIRSRKIQSNIKKVQHTQKGITHMDVTIYPLVTNSVEGVVIRVDDVTERVSFEEMLIQSEKMLSVGGLAAGMAHEINNPLAGIVQSAEVISSRLIGDMNNPGSLKAAQEAGTNLDAVRKFMVARSIPRMIEAISESSGRVADIVNNMLSFARKSDSARSSHSLSDLMERTLKLASTDYDLKNMYDFKHIAISREYQENLPVINCEETKIQQVFLNILRNSAQALQKALTQNPRIIIRIFKHTTERYLVVEIEDNGPGMNEDTAKRIFEPFFTTKDVGEGTGLGLSVSYFIISQNHNGKLSVVSSPGEGAKFIIQLPLSVTGENCES